MRSDVEEEERERKGEEDSHGPPSYGDFGFHHEFSYVEMTVRILENSNWVCWPESGGWAQQDAFLISDVLSYLRLRRRTRWEVKHNYKGYEELSGDRPKKKFFG